MFTVQKKLLEREQALHETVLSHWKNIPGLAATGLLLKFSDDVDVDLVCSDRETKSSESAKRQASGATMARRDRRKRFKTKLKGKYRRFWACVIYSRKMQN